MSYPLVRELAESGIPVAVTCRVLKLSRQAYYRWLANPTTTTELEQAYLANALFDAHRDDPEFRCRLLGDEPREGGLSACDHTMWALCAEGGWWSAFGKKRGSKGSKRPSLCSNRTVGYSISDRMKSSLAVDDLNSAVARRGIDGTSVAGCIVHSDRGSQFRSRKLMTALHAHDPVGSMGQVASAGDNAAMESFFSPPQKNDLDRQRWTIREQLRIRIITWIERTTTAARPASTHCPHRVRPHHHHSGRTRRLRTAVTYPCRSPGWV